MNVEEKISQLKKEVDRLLHEKTDLQLKYEAEISRLRREAQKREAQVKDLHNSLSWRITAPLRSLGTALNFQGAQPVEQKSDRSMPAVAPPAPPLPPVSPAPITNETSKAHPPIAQKPEIAAPPKSLVTFTPPTKVHDELLIYLDPGFFSDWGHYTNFATRIHEEAKKREVDLWHFSTHDVAEESKQIFSLIPLFQHRAMLPAEAGFVDSHLIEQGYSISQLIDEKLIDKETRKVLKSFRERIIAILEKLSSYADPYKKITAYMYTGHPLYIGIIAEILGSYDLNRININFNLGLFYLNLDFCIGKSMSGYQNLLNLTSNCLETFDKDGKIKIFADSERTINLYSKYFKRNIILSPIPLSRPAPHQNLGTLPGEITVGFFGFAHEKQGYPLFLALYEEIISDPKYEHVGFIARHNLKFSPKAQREVAEGFLRKTERIIHLPGNFMPAEEYDKYLDACDIVVVPHSREHYPCQTSGIFTDSLMKGKVLVVPENTWMADELKFHGSGESFVSDNEKSFILAVKKIVDDFSEYQKERWKNVNSFLKFHNTSSLFDSIGISRRAVKEKVIRTPNRRLIKNEDALEFSKNQLESFRNRHIGKRCVIVGNGPSLNKMDLSFLKDEITIGMNRIYLGFEKFGFHPTYYLTVNTLVIRQSVEEIAKINAPKFLSIYGLPYVPKPEEMIFLQPVWGPLFARDPRDGICEGCTVTYVAMQLAYFMGFSEVVLIGVDHNFETKGDPNKEIVSQGADPNHFHPDYFGKGTHWQLPDLPASEVHYRLARCVFEREGRKIVDATYEGKLEIFPKADYHDIFVNNRTGRITDEIIAFKPDKLPLVSIISSTTGNLFHLERTLKSIDEQSYLNIEVILVAKEDLDITYLGISEGLKGKIRQLRVDADANMNAMRNAGVRASHGEYLTYLDEGDLILPDHVAGLASHLQAYGQFDAAYVRTREFVFEKAGDQELEIFTGVLFDKKFDRNSLFQENYIPYLALMHRAQALGGEGPFDEGLEAFGFWDLLIRLGYAGEISALPVASARYFRNSPINKPQRVDKGALDTYLRKIHEKHQAILGNNFMKNSKQVNSDRSERLIISSEMGVLKPAISFEQAYRQLARAHESGSFFEAGSIIDGKIIPCLSLIPEDPCSAESFMSGSSDSGVGEAPRAVVATSIAPFNLDKQKTAIASWIKAGFKVISLNSEEEIRKIEGYFPAVEFVKAHRDARDISGKPHVFFDDVLSALLRFDSEFYGIVNSDIILDVDKDFTSFVQSKIDNGMVIGSRADVNNTESLRGSFYPIGFDYFFFTPSVAQCYPAEKFGIGMPWWDYWAPLVPMMKGFSVKQIVPPIGYHVLHSFQWSQKVYEELGTVFLDRIEKEKWGLQIDQDVVSEFGNNHGLFLGVLRHIHDNCEKISYKKYDSEFGFREVGELIDGLVELEKSYSRRIRMGIFQKYISDIYSVNKHNISSLMTVAHLYGEKKKYKESGDILLECGSTLFNAGRVSDAKNMLLRYRNMVNA